MAHRGGSFSRSRPTPKYTWFTFGEASVNDPIPSKVLGVAGAQAQVSLTTVRIRGTVGAVLDTGGINEAVMVRFGLVKVTGDAFAAGATSIPGPGSDREADWIWTGQLFLDSGAEAAIVTENLSAQLSVDTKAMRKLRAGDTFAFMAETLAAEITDQGGTLDFFYAIDVLNRTA